MPPAFVIMTGVHDHAETALNFESDDVPIQDGPSGGAAELAGGEDGRNERTTRMRKRHETHVVVIERMGGNPVRQSGVTRPGTFGPSENLAGGVRS